MKFFVPGADTPEMEASVYSAIKQFITDGEGEESLSKRRVWRLAWKHDGELYEAEVGKVAKFNDELVIAILYDPTRDLYHVCTPNRGVLRGPSILAGRGISAEDFED